MSGWEIAFIVLATAGVALGVVALIWLTRHAGDLWNP